MKSSLCKLLVIFSFFIFTSTVSAKTIMYVPFDDRPVSLDNAIDTVKAAKLDILVPPVELLASRDRNGDPVELWEWIKSNAQKADAFVLSADALIYGGLVDSRTHMLDSKVLDWRVKHFSELRKMNAAAPIYVFSTIMRSPYASAGGVEPPYYEKYGTYIYQLTALQDKAEVQTLTDEEHNTLLARQKAIPREYLADWMSRREKNFKVNTELIKLTQSGTLNYLLLGRDDTSPFSQSHRESRSLNKLAAGLTKNQFTSFPGADQLGMVLLARAYNQLMQQTPIVEVQYALGPESATIATYEDQPIGGTIADHIIAAGGKVMQHSQKPDLFLAVNTPLQNHTEEAETFENLSILADSTNQFVDVIQHKLAAGQAVAVADIAYANGADNSLMFSLYEHGLLDKLNSYSGWNTASNTLGYALGQGMMSKSMSNQDHKKLLAVRYLDDWAYQANIRKEICRTIVNPQNINEEYLDNNEPELLKALRQEIGEFAKHYLWVTPDKIKVSFPWNRMFEIKVEVEQ